MPRSSLDSRPDPEHVAEAVAQAERYFAPQIAKDQRALDAYYNDFRIDVPNLEDPARTRLIHLVRYHLSEAPRIVDRLRALYTTFASAGVMSQGGRPASAAMVERVEMALNECRDQMVQATDCRKGDHFNLFTMGRVAKLGPIYGKDYWWDFPERGGKSEDEWRAELDRWHTGAPLPLIEISLPAEATFPTTWGHMGEEAVSWQQMTWRELQNIFAPDELGPAPEDRQGHQDYMLAIYSNRQYLSYALMGEGGMDFSANEKARAVRTVQHRLGRSAIRILSGPVTGRREAGRYWISALSHVLVLIDAIDRMATLAGGAAEADLFPPLEHRQFADLTEGQEAETKTYGLGDIIPTYVDRATGAAESISAIVAPTMGQKNAELLQLYLQRASIISGALEIFDAPVGPGSETAWARRAKLDTATHVVKPFTDAVVAADLDAYEMMMRSVAEFDEPVTLWKKDGQKLALMPDDVRDLHSALKVDYRLQLPTSAIADMQMTIELVAAGNEQNVPIPWTYAFENFANIEQPYELYQRWIGDQALLDPNVVQKLRQRKLELIGVDLAFDDAMSVEDMMAIPDEEMPIEAKLAALQAAGIAVPGADGAMAPPTNGAAPVAGGLQTNPMQGAAMAGAPFSMPLPQRQALLP